MFNKQVKQAWMNKIAKTNSFQVSLLIYRLRWYRGWENETAESLLFNGWSVLGSHADLATRCRRRWPTLSFASSLEYDRAAWCRQCTVPLGVHSPTFVALGRTLQMHKDITLQTNNNYCNSNNTVWLLSWLGRVHIEFRHAHITSVSLPKPRFMPRY